MKLIKKDLLNYIEKKIYPEYDKNEEGHRLPHIKYVIQRSLNFAAQFQDIDKNMVYTIAAYHDIGHHIDAKNHEIVSAQIFYKDDKIKQFFTSEEIEIIKEAIEDHRASSNKEPRSIYGKIVSSADRNTSLEDIIKRAYLYRIEHYGTNNIDEIILESQKHIKEKYGSRGYAKEKMYFQDLEYDKFLEEIDKICDDNIEFRKKFIEVNKIKIKWEN